MHNKPLLSVIVPAYNEAKRLPLTLIDMHRHLERVDFPYEVIVVDNNSTDATAEVVTRFTHIWPELKLVGCKTRGKGAAVKAGMAAAVGRLRAFTDADNSISIEQMVKTMPYFNQGYGVVIGSRDIPGASHDQPWYRRIAGNTGNLIIQTLLLPGIWDTQCPLKVFSEEAAERVFPLMRIAHWGFDVEILALAKRFGYGIKEIPVKFVNDPHSKVKITTYMEVLLEVFKIRFWLWTGAYPERKK